MCVAVAVKLHPQEVRCKAYVTCADIDVVRGVYIIDGGILVVRPGDGIDRYGERNASTSPNQRGGSAYLIRGKVVQCSPLVVGSPTPPVLHRLEESIELLRRDAIRFCSGCVHVFTSSGKMRHVSVPATFTTS